MAAKPSHALDGLELSAAHGIAVYVIEAHPERSARVFRAIATQEQADLDAMSAHGIESIEVVAVNLYPFRETASRPGVRPEEVIENIDIGGPAMIRSAAGRNRQLARVRSAVELGGARSEVVQPVVWVGRRDKAGSSLRHPVVVPSTR